IPDLLGVKWVALLGAPLGILASIGLGVGVGAILDWPLQQGIAAGCIVSVASTMVLTRLLMDRGELSTEAGRVMVTLTLVEDLAVVILTVLLPSFSLSGGMNVAQIAWRIGKALLLLIPVVLAGWKLIPLLLALTICLAIAAVTEAIGLSLALGAFLAGLLLGSSGYSHQLAQQTLPLRDAFVALFFATIGMLIDPATWLSGWRVVVAFLGLILVGKLLIWSGVVRLFGYSRRTAFRVGIGLTQIGEFSFILAQVSRDAGLISADVYNATLAASLVTILVNATFFRFLKTPAAEPVQTLSVETK